MVITFADISEIKTAERKTEAARAYSDSIIDTIRQPLVVLDEQLRVVSANRSFYLIFGRASEETVGRLLVLAGNVYSEIPGLRAFFDRIRRSPFRATITRSRSSSRFLGGGSCY